MKYRIWQKHGIYKAQVRLLLKWHWLYESDIKICPYYAYEENEEQDAARFPSMDAAERAAQKYIEYRKSGSGEAKFVKHGNH